MAVLARRLAANVDAEEAEEDLLTPPKSAAAIFSFSVSSRGGAGGAGAANVLGLGLGDDG